MGPVGEPGGSPRRECWVLSAGGGARAKGLSVSDSVMGMGRKPPNREPTHSRTDRVPRGPDRCMRWFWESGRERQLAAGVGGGREELLEGIEPEQRWRKRVRNRGKWFQVVISGLPQFPHL